MSDTPFHVVYKNIVARCTNKKVKNYHRYGGRGIKNRWASFLHFKEDMFGTYKPGLFIERINNDGDYCKENCRWATREEQNNNRSTNVSLTHMGQTLTIAKWEKQLGFRPGTLKYRIRKGWDVKMALETGPSRSNRTSRFPIATA